MPDVFLMAHGQYCYHYRYSYPSVSIHPTGEELLFTALTSVVGVT